MSDSHNATRPSKRADGPALSRRISARDMCGVVVAMCIATMTDPGAGGPFQSSRERPALDRPTLSDAQRLFYNARYEAAAALALDLRVADTQDLPNDELRSSALLFQLKALLEGCPDNEKALKNCATCPQLVAEFLADIRHGQALAHTTLRSTPGDEAALFYLGKLDLNYVWLQLGPLRRKTGWDEYWEARRSLGAVLAHNPRHIRARVARAWIDYIVDTKMPWGTRWLLGGVTGSRRSSTYVRPRTWSRTSLATRKPNLRCGIWRSESVTWCRRPTWRAGSPATSQTIASWRPSWRLAKRVYGDERSGVTGTAISLDCTLITA